MLKHLITFGIGLGIIIAMLAVGCILVWTLIKFPIVWVIVGIVGVSYGVGHIVREDIW